jgi:hypothetical protein
MTDHERPDRIIELRWRPANSSNRHLDGGTSRFEIICRMCGDDPALDHRQASARLRRVRGSYTLMAGIAALLIHQEFHARAEDTTTRQAGARVFVSAATARAQITLTSRELIAATRRQAIARARELGLWDG